MIENYSEKSLKNLELLGSDLTMDFIFDNTGSVARKSIVRNLSITILNEIYGVKAIRACSALNYHRNSYYGVKKKIKEKLNRDEVDIARNIIKSYHLRERMDSIVCQIDPSTIIDAIEELLDLLEIDEKTKLQVLGKI